MSEIARVESCCFCPFAINCSTNNECRLTTSVAKILQYISGLICIIFFTATLSIVAVSCSGVALCLIVICVGVACLRRWVADRTCFSHSHVWTTLSYYQEVGSNILR